MPVEKYYESRWSQKQVVEKYLKKRKHFLDEQIKSIMFLVRSCVVIKKRKGEEVGCGFFDSGILMFVLERQFVKPQIAIIQIKIIVGLKSLLYICIDIFIFLYI